MVAKYGPQMDMAKRPHPLSIKSYGTDWHCNNCGEPFDVAVEAVVVTERPPESMLDYEIPYCFACIKMVGDALGGVTWSNSFPPTPASTVDRQGLREVPDGHPAGRGRHLPPRAACKGSSSSSTRENPGVYESLVDKAGATQPWPPRQHRHALRGGALRGLAATDAASPFKLNNNYRSRYAVSSWRTNPTWSTPSTFES